MDIHIAVKEILAQYGLELIRDSKLVNYLADVNCFAEFHSAKNILKELLTSYGENIFSIKIHNEPYELELIKYRSEFSKAHGYQIEIINYLFDSISYGLSWENNADYSLKKLRNTHSYSEKTSKSNNRLRFFANLYHYFGINVTCIKGKPEDKVTYLYDDPVTGVELRHPFKEPSDSNWKSFFDEEQDVDYISDQDWEEASGIGAVIGYNGLRALDFDDVYFLNPNHRNLEIFGLYVNKVLDLLNLPSDYQWVVKSGSGCGFHIIFKTKEISDLGCDSVGFVPSEKSIKECGRFARMELRWKDHLVLPPSKSIGYYDDDLLYFPECQWYTFYHGNFPNYAPKEVEIGNLNNLLNYFSSVISKVSYVGTAPIIGNKKLTTNIDSWGGNHIQFKATENWAKACQSNDNEEYVTYLLKDSYKKPDNLQKAVEILRRYNSAISHYNLASLIANNKIEGTKSEAMTHFSIAQQCKDIDVEAIDLLKRDVERMK